jgi:hypothetical protein
MPTMIAFPSAEPLEILTCALAPDPEESAIEEYRTAQPGAASAASTQIHIPERMSSR